jgi:superfamily II DNA helicase RecQ
MKCKVFKIPLQGETFYESKINDFLANVEAKQIFASVVNDIESFWSVMVFYREAGVKSNRSSSTGGKSYSIPASAAIEAKQPEPEVLSPAQERAFQSLRAWRDERARLEGLPAYVVAHDELLMQIASAPITSTEDLLRIRDFGHKRTEIYGDEIVKILFANA